MGKKLVRDSIRLAAAAQCVSQQLDIGAGVCKDQIVRPTKCLEEIVSDPWGPISLGIDLVAA